MRILGIIAEFNPLHNGHQYLIRKAKEMTGADYCILVMSGNYVQRGECALFHKDLRTKAALTAGADAVFEIPLCFATGSAEYYAFAAISLLTRLGCVTDLCFGSETGDLNLLWGISELLTKETASFEAALKKHLSEGCSFPVAREKAFREVLLSEQEAPVPENAPFLPDLTGSNDILGIEYLRAINRLSSPITPHVIKRLGAYHAEGGPAADQGTGAGDEAKEPFIFASAEQLRLELEKDWKGSEAVLFAKWEKEVPSDVLSDYRDAILKKQYLFPDDLTLPLIQTLNYETPERLQQIQDMSKDLSNRVLSLRDLQLSFTGLISAVKSRNLTYTRISRALLHTILHITAEEVSRKKEDGYVQYASLLGFRRSARDLLTLVKEKSDIPIITSVGDAAKVLNDTQLADHDLDLRRDAFYEKLLCCASGVSTSERTVYQRRIVIL